MQPVENSQVDAVRRDARELRKLCAQLLPDFAATHRPVRLSSQAPSLVRAFWEELGYSPALGFLVDSPEDDQVQAAAELVASWRADGRSSRRQATETDARAELLPASFRVVSIDSEEAELYITDESGGDIDPPVYLVSSRDQERRRVSASYLRHISRDILSLAFSVGPTRCTVAFTSPPVGTPAFPALAPSALSLGEGLWRIVPDPPVGPVGEPAEFVGYTSLDRFVSHLQGMPEDAISYTGRPRGDLVAVEGVSDEAMQALELTWFSWTFQTRSQRLGVGRVDGVAVSVDPIGPEMYCFRTSPEAREAFVNWVWGQGFRVRYVTAWQEQFAVPGGVSFE